MWTKALVLLAAVSAAAQVRESITVSYVEVPVTVVDRGGNAVRGLTKANFEIIDEGTKRAISGFDAVDFASREAELPSGSGLALPSVAPAARRNFLLVFDLSYASPNSLTRAKAAARKFVAQMASKDDLIGVATVDVAYGFRVLSSFTTDRAIVDAAVADPKNFRALDPLQLAGAEMPKEMQDLVYADAKGGEHVSDMPETPPLLVEQRKMDDAYNREKVDREINLLAGLARTLRSVRGQKHLVLLSEGFDARMIQGRDASLDRETVQENNAVEQGHLWLVDNDRRFGSSASMSLVDRLADVAKRSGVVIDSIDIAGIRTYVDPSEGYQTGSARKSNEGLHLLSGVTGGTVFKNSNDLSADFQRVLKTEEVVYVLAFQAPASKPGTFHSIKVKLVDVPGARVMARSGYYEAGAEGGQERTLSNAEIITSDIPEDAVHVASLAVPFSTLDDNAQVPVILEIDGKDATLGTSGTATLEIFTYAFDSDGKVRDSMYQRAALDLNKVGATLNSTGVKYYATLSLPPGKYAVKSLVRVAETDRKGFVRSDVVVPAKGEVAVTQPLFQDQGTRWVMVKGGSHDRTHAAYPFVVNGASFVPSASAHVKNGEPRRFVVFVENAAPDELTIEMHPEAKLIAQLRSDRGAKLVYELAPNPRTSVLNVSVRKRGVSQPASASVTLQ